MTEETLPLSEKISEEVLEFIIDGLSMFDIVKVGNINKYYYKISESNHLWEPIYEKLFNRTYIDENSVHDGCVTWWSCKVGAYPGWSRIHEPIDNTGHKCRIRSHYSCLSEKKSKVKYKNYKKMVMRRYRTLVLADTKVKTNSVDKTQLRYWKRCLEKAQIQVNCIEKKINNEIIIKDSFTRSEGLYKDLENKPRKTRKKKDSDIQKE